jgi:hypothetical protein
LEEYSTSLTHPAAEEMHFRAVYGGGHWDGVFVENKPLSDQYKRRAAECVRMAERTDNAEDKALLLQMAQTWMRLAEKAEERTEEK